MANTSDELNKTTGGIIFVALIIFAGVVGYFVGSADRGLDWACSMKPNQAAEYCEVGGAGIVFYGDDFMVVPVR